MQVLVEHRVVGQGTIQPDPEDMAAMDSAGDPVAIILKICVDTGGKTSKVEVLRSNAPETWVRKVVGGIYAWRFRPVLGDGKPVPVCALTVTMYRPAAPKTP